MVDAEVMVHLPSGDAVSREEMGKWAMVIAEKYPGAGFVNAKAYAEEFDRVVSRLGFKVPAGEMTDETCIHCLNPREPNKARAKEDIYAANTASRNWKSLGEVLVTKEELSRVEI
jgi:hypothetical protein